MKLMCIVFLSLFILFISMPLRADEDTEAQSGPALITTEEQRLRTLQFGTETEIAGLIQVLKNEKVSYLDE